MSLDQEENDLFQDQESGIDFKVIFPKIFRIWPIIILSIGLFLLGAYYVTQTTPPSYRVTSKFFIKENEKGFSFLEIIICLSF